MDLAGRMQQLEEMVRDAKSMPLSSSALLKSLLGLPASITSRSPGSRLPTRATTRGCQAMVQRSRASATR